MTTRRQRGAGAGRHTPGGPLRALACAVMAVALATVGACTPDTTQSEAQSAQSSRDLDADTVLLTATDTTGTPMTGEQIRATLLGGEKAAAAADARATRAQSGAAEGSAQSGSTQSGGAQSGSAHSGDAAMPRGLAVIDPKTWEVEEDTDPVVAVEQDGIRVEVPSGGAAIALVWPLSETYGYSQVVIGDDGSPIRPGGTLDLTLRILEELTGELQTSVTDALDDTSGTAPLPTFDVSSGLAGARRAVETADSAHSASPDDSASSGGSAPTPSSSVQVPVAQSLAALDQTWRTWLGELGRAGAGTGGTTGARRAGTSGSTTDAAPTPSHSASPGPTGKAPLDSIWRAVTLDDASSPNVMAALDQAVTAAGDGQGWVRIVASPDRQPSDYDQAIIAAHDRGLKVMLTPTDASAAAACVPAGAPTACTTDDYLARLTTYLDHFSGSGVPDVDAWEVGNEANTDRIDTTHGTYTAGSADMSTKVTTATTLVRSRTSAPVVLTLDWQLATAVHAASSTFSWAHAQAATSGVESPDVVLLSTWLDRSPLGIGILPALEHLASTFPGAKVGIGELGLRSGADAGPYDEFGVAASQGAHRSAATAALAGWYTESMTCTPESIGGGFWWTFQQDATAPTGAELVDALRAAASGS